LKPINNEKKLANQRPDRAVLEVSEVSRSWEARRRKRQGPDASYPATSTAARVWGSESYVRNLFCFGKTSQLKSPSVSHFVMNGAIPEKANVF
jgi:hypothetical protein